MLGRLGWRGQCSCCNGPKDTKAIRAEEKRGWLDEAFEATADVAQDIRDGLFNATRP